MKSCALVAAAALLAGCGGGDQPPDPRPVVERYFAALARGDAAGACATMSAESQAKLADFGQRQLRVRSGGCAATIKTLLRSKFGAGLRSRARGSRITSVDVSGSTATVVATGAAAPLRLELQGAGWRIDSSPAGGPD